MKRGRNILYLIFSAIIILAFISFASAGFFSDFLDKITGQAVKNVGVNISIGVSRVTNVYNTSASIIALANAFNAGPNPSCFEINFTAYQGAGTKWLNHSTAKVNISKAGELTRENSTCITLEVGANYANYTCNVTMWWWDGSGVWTIDANIIDNFSITARNVSANISISATTGFEMGPVNLTWSSIGAGATNQTSTNDPLKLNNTGNQQIGISTNSNISINATDLVGETNNGYRLFGSNFSAYFSSGGAGCAADACTECVGTEGNLTKSHYANISNSNLTKGNYTAENTMPSGERVNGSEELYFCLRITGTDLITQAYSTLTEGVWTIKI